MRLTIKLSGAGLTADKSRGSFDEGRLHLISTGIRMLTQEGHEVTVVVGSGNLFRGQALSESLSVKRATGDYVGMLATLQNALVLRDYLTSQGLEVRVSSAIHVTQMAEPYMPLRVRRHLEKGRVVVFAGGTGLPFFTTDTATIQRALETGADLVIMVKNGVDGVYDRDPKQDKKAKKITDISYADALEQSLEFADSTALALAREHALSTKVIGLSDITRALEDGIGTFIHPS